ncbi:ferredoxin:glutaredoxin reductase [Candidatus Bathyarchaeota archaeon]|nr:ferredoxin:glutaredoxin reductase [Candidatus Bathyarchaeota archaeon]
MTTLKKVRQRAENDADAHGYNLNSDQYFLHDLLQGLQKNEERYGYPSCPCRVASGELEFDRDIICPCDYRDPDIAQYGACYCTLYIRKDVTGKTIPPIPERRPLERQVLAYEMRSEIQEKRDSTHIRNSKEHPSVTRKLWCCRQCGYICFRENPPYTCPICKAKRKMFAELHARTFLEPFLK